LRPLDLNPISVLFSEKGPLFYSASSSSYVQLFAFGRWVGRLKEVLSYGPHRSVLAIGMRRLFCINLLVLTAGVGCGGGGSATPPQPPPPPQVVVNVFPTKATVPVGTVQPFQALVSNAPNDSVTWTASAGTIDQSGNYAAPLSVPPGGTATVTATATASPSVSASVTVTITEGPVALSISPLTAIVKAGLTQTFTAKVSGTTNTSISWSLTDLPGDSTYPGSLSGGAYTAPSPIFTPDTFTVSVVSNADPTKQASASVRVLPLENQEQQEFPIQLGTSGINANTAGYCCSGTLGSLLADQKGKQYILSNNHVVGRNGYASAGEPVVQPGFIDSQCDFSLPKTVANFTLAPPLNTSNVDAGIAQVVPGAVDSQGEIIGLGGIASDGSYIPAPPAKTIVAPAIGMAVAKSGRTTGLTCGTILGINATVRIQVEPVCGTPSATVVVFNGQVILGKIVQPGDSGSLIVEAATARPVALVAGGSADGELTTANPINDVLTALNNSSHGLTFSFAGAGQHAVSCSTTPGSVQLSSPQESAQVLSSVIPPEEIAHVMEVQQKYETEVMRDPSVMGMAIGSSHLDPGHASFLVFVDDAKVGERLPVFLDGVAVRVIHSGPFWANLQATQAARARCASRSARREPFRFTDQ